jgi:hypothetical protein
LEKRAEGMAVQKTGKCRVDMRDKSVTREEREEKRKR